jgi:hypothetical protein
MSAWNDSAPIVQHYKSPASQIPIISSAHSACIINTSTANQHNSVPFTVAITHSAIPAIWHYAVRHTCYCVQKYIANNASGQALPCGMRFLRNSVSRIQSSWNTTPCSYTVQHSITKTNRAVYSETSLTMYHTVLVAYHMSHHHHHHVSLWRSELLDN